LGTLSDDPDECWSAVSSVSCSSAEQTVGYCRKKRQSWLSDAAFDVLQEKADTKLRADDAKRRSLQANFQKIGGLQTRKPPTIVWPVNRKKCKGRQDWLSVPGSARYWQQSLELLCSSQKAGWICVQEQRGYTLERWCEHHHQAVNHGPGRHCQIWQLILRVLSAA